MRDDELERALRYEQGTENLARVLFSVIALAVAVVVCMLSLWGPR